MQLYEINVDEYPAVHVVARTGHEAVDVFITFEAARGRVHQCLTVKPIPASDLDPERGAKILHALAVGFAGVLHHDDEMGWLFSTPLCTGSDSDGLPVHAVEGGAR